MRLCALVVYGSVLTTLTSKMLGSADVILWSSCSTVHLDQRCFRQVSHVSMESPDSDTHTTKESRPTTLWFSFSHKMSWKRHSVPKAQLLHQLLRLRLGVRPCLGLPRCRRSCGSDSSSSVPTKHVCAMHELDVSSALSGPAGSLCA